MNPIANIRRSTLGLLSILLLLGTVVTPQMASADITCCIFQNGAPCVNVCYVTDLTCADINVGFLITSCTDMIANGGGGGGGALLENINALYDGQVNIGNGPIAGTVDLIATELTQFFVTRPVSPHNNLDQTVEILGISLAGEVYVAEVPTGGLDRFVGGDLVIQSTRGGMGISEPLNSESSGRMAIGDITLSVSQIDRTDNETVLSSTDTPVIFSDLVWTYVGGGAVGVENVTWDTVKAHYTTSN
jgi:hypothetical protein